MRQSRDKLRRLTFHVESLREAEGLAWEVDRTRTQASHGTPSNREFQVLRLIAAGKSATRISRELHPRP
jgi:DNA-binding NarL/FixJ family response regulator